MNIEGDIVIFWFRRDLRIEDNRGLRHALESGFRVLPVFIFDSNILSGLEADDSRITFIHQCIEVMHQKLRQYGSGLLTINGDPGNIFRGLTGRYSIKAVYANADYEQYSIRRDAYVRDILKSSGATLQLYEDQLIAEPGRVLKPDGKPYTVFAPFLRRWQQEFREEFTNEELTGEVSGAFLKSDQFPHPLTPASIGFTTGIKKVRDFDISRSLIERYEKDRDIPSADGVTGLGPHLRFGTVSIREVFRKTTGISTVFTSELVWREFFMHILKHFPHVENGSFRPRYDNIEWENNEEQFDCWCRGMTGYPLVDAGMRELKETGYMHNRVRMVTASFLTKHLLCDWRWGEAWFASLLLDYELSSNNGNWQWAAGTGCDAAPYFRVFNPTAQQQRFDADMKYIRKWVPEYGTKEYPEPIVEHEEARRRAVLRYREALNAG